MKRGRKKKRVVHISMADWVPINFHPKTGQDLRRQGYIMHKKTGRVHKTSYND